MITIPSSTPPRFRIPAKPKQAEPKRAIEYPVVGVSIPQAAKMIGVSTKTIMPLIKDGDIRSVRLGKRVIVSVQSLRDFVDGKEEPYDSVLENQR